MDPEAALKQANMHKKLEEPGMEPKVTPGAVVELHYECKLAGSMEVIDSSKGEHVSNVGGLIVRKSANPIKVCEGLESVVVVCLESERQSVPRVNSE